MLQRKEKETVGKLSTREQKKRENLPSRSLFDQDYNLITCEPKRGSHSLRVESKRKKRQVVPQFSETTIKNHVRKSAQLIVLHFIVFFFFFLSSSEFFWDLGITELQN